MNGSDDEDYSDEDEIMAVDEFFALPGVHHKKVLFYKEMCGLSDEENDDS